MKPALLVIDMLKEFVYGRLKSPYASEIVPVIRVLIAKAHEKKIPVIYLVDRHWIFDSEIRIWGPHAMHDSEEATIIDELKPEAEDIVLHKRSYSGFRDTGLASILRDLGVNTVILTGIHTHICVLHTAIDAFYERFNIIVVRDGVSAFSKEDHEYALQYMERVLGAKLLNHREALNLLDAISTM